MKCAMTRDNSWRRRNGMVAPLANMLSGTRRDFCRAMVHGPDPFSRARSERPRHPKSLLLGLRLRGWNTQLRLQMRNRHRWPRALRR